MPPALRRRRMHEPDEPAPPPLFVAPLFGAIMAPQSAPLAFNPVTAATGGEDSDPPPAPAPGIPLFDGTPQRLYDHARPRHFGAPGGPCPDDPLDTTLPVESVLARLRVHQDGQPPRFQAVAPPAHTAASRGDLAGLQRVHASDPAALYALDGEGRSVLCVAAEAGSRGVVQWLVELHPADWPAAYHVAPGPPAGAPRLAADSLLGRTHPALAAARMGRVDVAGYLVDAWPLEVVTERADWAAPLPTLDALHELATHTLAAMLVCAACVAACCACRAVVLAAWAIPWRGYIPSPFPVVVYSLFLARWLWEDSAMRPSMRPLHIAMGVTPCAVAQLLGTWTTALLWRWSAFAPARLLPRFIVAWAPLAGATGLAMLLVVIAHSLRRVWREEADSEAPPAAASDPCGRAPPRRMVWWWPLRRASRRVLVPAFDMADVQLRVLRHLAMHAQRDALLAWIGRRDVALLLRAVNDATARSDGDAVECWTRATPLPRLPAAAGRAVCVRASAARAFAAAPPPALVAVPSADTWPLDDAQVRWAAARALLRSLAALLLSQLPPPSAWLDALLCGAAAPPQLGGRAPWRRSCALRLRLPYHPREATACFAATLVYLAHSRQLAALHAVSHAAWAFCAKAPRGQVRLVSVAPRGAAADDSSSSSSSSSSSHGRAAPAPPPCVDPRRLWPAPEFVCLGGAYTLLPHSDAARLHMDLLPMWASSFALAQRWYGHRHHHSAHDQGTDPMLFLARAIELARPRSGNPDLLADVASSQFDALMALSGSTVPASALLFLTSLKTRMGGRPRRDTPALYHACDVACALLYPAAFAVAIAAALLGALAGVALLSDPVGVTVRVAEATLERSALLWTYGEALLGGLVYGSNADAYDELREAAPAVPLPTDALRRSLLRARRGGGGGGGGAAGDARAATTGASPSSSTEAPVDEVDLDADVPPDMIDPVMQGLLGDPVAAFDGHTYSRAALARWVDTCVFAQRPATSPLTNLPLGATLQPAKSPFELDLLRVGVHVALPLPRRWAEYLAGLYPAVPNPIRAARIALHWSYVAAADRAYMLSYARFMGNLWCWALRRVRVVTLVTLVARLLGDALLLLGELGACAASLALAVAAGLAFVSSSLSYVLVFRAPVVCGCRAARAAPPHRYVARGVYWAVYVAVIFGWLCGGWYAHLAWPRARG